jgi:2-dehydropantoate 2-reductase
MTPSIQTICVIGHGAMGAAYASIFYTMDKNCVSFLAGGERFHRLRRDGVIVNERHYSIPVLRPEDRSPAADLVMVAVKHHHLDAAIPDLENRVGKETTILSVMNGIESEERIGAAYGMDVVLYGVAVGIDAVRVGHRVSYANRGKILFGAAKNSFLTERVTRVQALFDRAGIPYETPPDMVRTLWWKFMINVGINQASAALRAPYSVFQTSQEARDLMDSAMREVMVVASNAGVHLSETDLAHWYTILLSLNPQGKTSMLQDVEAGRKTEVEMFAGKVIELGRHYNVPTPVNERLYTLIKEIEGSYEREHGGV